MNSCKRFHFMSSQIMTFNLYIAFKEFCFYHLSFERTPSTFLLLSSSSLLLLLILLISFNNNNNIMTRTYCHKCRHSYNPCTHNLLYHLCTECFCIFQLYPSYNHNIVFYVACESGSFYRSHSIFPSYPSNHNL